MNASAAVLQQIDRNECSAAVVIAAAVAAAVAAVVVVRPLIG